VRCPTWREISARPYHVEQSAGNPKLFVVTYHAEHTQANEMYAKLKELGPTLSNIEIHAPGE